MARPTKLSEDIILRLCEALAIGCTNKQAAQYAGIAVSTFYGWMDRARNGNDTEFIEFMERIEKANAQRVISNLAVIRRAAKDGSWQASAWLLERRDGFIKNPEPLVEVNIDASQLSVKELLQKVQGNQQIVDDILQRPMIDLDE